MKKALSGIFGAGVIALWLISNNSTVTTVAAATGNAEKGKEVFEQCSACHNVENDEKKMGPSLKGLYKRDKLKNGKKVTDSTVKAMIDAGGNGMPAYADMLSDQEKADVIAYLHTI
jgi:cytochrome c2